MSVSIVKALNILQKGEHILRNHNYDFFFKFWKTCSMTSFINTVMLTLLPEFIILRKNTNIAFKDCFMTKSETLHHIATGSQNKYPIQLAHTFNPVLWLLTAALLPVYMHSTDQYSWQAKKPSLAKTSPPQFIYSRRSSSQQFSLDPKDDL